LTQAARASSTQVPITSVNVSAFRIPTETPESDGTLEWQVTTLVVAEVGGGGKTGFGYTYADESTAHLIKGHLQENVVGSSAFSIPECWRAMIHSIRNFGRPGIASMAVSCVDIALWDLKAKLLGISVAQLLGTARTSVPAYASGGFTSYSMEELTSQMSGWDEQDFRMLKMKIGREPDQDLKRVEAARNAIGSDVALFVDANGAYSRKQALAFAEAFRDLHVIWFEEPVSSDDLAGLRFLRERSPGSMDIAAGEYGYDLDYFHSMLQARSVDVLQADVSRCAGVTGFLQVAALCEAYHVPFSAHCVPSVHASLGCALANLRHIEYFFDHQRIEHRLMAGAPTPVRGMISPDLSAPGFGLELKRSDAQRFAI
jgi:L-alanine-DL-glutamate epimerase-like enolase superfamily enzyme